MNNEWIENTGSVPEGVEPDTPIEVEYRDGFTSVVKSHLQSIQTLWTIQLDSDDIIRWRFHKEET